MIIQGADENQMVEIFLKKKKTFTKFICVFFL